MASDELKPIWTLVYYDKELTIGAIFENVHEHDEKIILAPDHKVSKDVLEGIVERHNSAHVSDEILKVIKALEPVGMYLSAALDDDKCGQDFKDKINVLFSSLEAIPEYMEEIELARGVLLPKKDTQTDGESNV